MNFEFIKPGTRIPSALIIAAAIFAVLAGACTPSAGSGASAVRDRESSAKPPASKSVPANATVVGVNDGDTITVRMHDSGKQEKIRLATIDAPELNQPFGQASKQSLSGLVFGKEVQVAESGQDRYGRIVAEVFIGDFNVNIEQIRRGFAWHYKKHEREQTEQQRKVYSAVEESAKQGRSGLWRDANAVAPWEFRKQESGNRRQ